MTTKLANILHCYAMGMGIKGISSAFELSRNTVRRYVRLFQESGIPLEQLLSMPASRIQEMFGGSGERERTPSQRQTELEALLPEYAARLKRKGVTVKSLFEEYSQEYPDGYRHASFGIYLQRYRLVSRAVGHVEHYAGDQMYIDFAGDKLEVVDELSGECRSVEVFVAILPCSHYTYCEAVWSQRKEDLIKACENALHFYEGVPMAIVPDNLKSAVTRSDRNEPIINDDFAAFAEHYGCAVYPARVRHPKDKALVENAVKLMYKSVYADIEGLMFHDIESLNIAIQSSQEKFNSKQMSNRKESRKELFEEIEKDYLRSLPTVRYQMKERKSVTVMRNSYVTLGKHHYSVPMEYIGKRVDIVYDADTLEIFYGLRLVTTHHRDDTPYGYTQKEAHNLPGRRGSYEKDLDQVFERAAQIDNIVLLYLREVASQKKYPPLAFRSCRGILSLEKTFGLDRLVAEAMTADSFVSMLLAREWDYRSDAAIARLIRQAGFRYKAFLEEIDHTISRGLDRNQMERLASLDFIRQGQNLFITGSSGTGKSYMATVLGYQACKEGIRTNYASASKLMGALNGEPTVADAILDRIVHSAHQIELTSESVRKMKVGKNK